MNPMVSHSQPKSSITESVVNINESANEHVARAKQLLKANAVIKILVMYVNIA